MASIYDYLQWRGDLTFAERSFDDADNIILSSLSYFDFSGIVPGEGGDGIRLADACQQLLNKAGDHVEDYVRSIARLDARFLRLMRDSARFADATLKGYVDVIDEARALQFSAMQIDLPDAGTYIAYRGTDDTLVGWREDFMLSFKVTEAQREAAAYLKRAMERIGADCPALRVGGHSKGGNLAEYAVINLSEDLRSRITCVYSNDGPGIAAEVTSGDSRTILGDKLRRLVPTYSVVGMLFARAGDPRTIVASNGIGIGQHDPTTWQVNPRGVNIAKDLIPQCKMINETIARWQGKLDLDERERVTNELFDALAAGGATTFDEIASSKDGLQKVIKALRKMNDSSGRDVAMALIESTLSTSIDAVLKATNETMDMLKKNVASAAEETARKLLGQ
ncbi:MAG: DUF2974 domain-containing protein [Atopobiaceae bacterium]|nr:DUF2974 domain-containing protein [Atopobiaceae bacterium]